MSRHSEPKAKNPDDAHITSTARTFRPKLSYDSASNSLFVIPEGNLLFELNLSLSTRIAMSKIKTPQEKKLASLELDARNVYGENDKASRKLIPRRKQESHQAARRAAKQPLLHIAKGSTEEDFVDAEFDVLTQEIAGQRTGFRKRPDESLGTVLEVKQTGDHTIFKRYRKYR